MKTFTQFKQEVKDLHELTITTASGEKKVISKVPLTTITGKRIKAYPGKSSSSKGGDGD